MSSIQKLQNKAHELLLYKSFDTLNVSRQDKNNAKRR